MNNFGGSLVSSVLTNIRRKNEFLPRGAVAHLLLHNLGLRLKIFDVRAVPVAGLEDEIRVVGIRARQQCKSK